MGDLPDFGFYLGGGEGWTALVAIVAHYRRDVLSQMALLVVRREIDHRCDEKNGSLPSPTSLAALRGHQDLRTGSPHGGNPSLLHPVLLVFRLLILAHNGHVFARFLPVGPACCP